MISKLELSKMIDHSLLKPTVTKEETIKGIEIGLKYDVASVTIKPCWVRLAAEMCKGSDVLVDPVICFPFGYDTTETKVFATRQAIEDGADEIDMVMNLGMFLSGEYDYVQDDMKAVVDAAQGAPVKVIFETAYFLTDDAALTKACQMAEKAGAAFVKTSTGFAPAGYTFHQLKVMRDAVSDKVEVKAAQGVRSLEDALAVRELGVTRFGATSTVAIMQQWEARFG
jgi:deoxyribose-phosphate aldolase